MRQYIDVTGKTEEEAINAALAQLSMDRDDVSVELLERAKAGFLGLGSCPAKVRVYYGPEEEPAEKQPERKPEPKPEKRTEARPEKRVEPKMEQAEKKPKKVEETPVVPALGEEVDDEKAQAIRRFLTGLMEQMEVSAVIKVYQPEKGRYKVFLEGEHMGALIGRRGETLDAIQQLTSYAVNRTGGRVRVQLDAEGYRNKREQSLQHLARKVASKVTRYHRSVTLEPMNAYERHVIHVALQDVPGVTTHSTGVDPNRRVVVTYDRDKKRMKEGPPDGGPSFSLWTRRGA